jgi:hypothetical protein
MRRVLYHFTTALLIASILCLHLYLLIPESLEMENKRGNSKFFTAPINVPPLYLSQSAESESGSE